MELNHPSTPQSGAETHASADPDVHENKDLAAFSYVWIFSILVYFARRQSKFVAFHAKQAMILFTLSIVFWFIPLLGTVLELFAVFGMVWGFIHAAQGKWDEVPFVGPLARGKLSLRPSLRKAVSGVATGVGEAKRIWKDQEQTPPRSTPPEHHNKDESLFKNL